MPKPGEQIEHHARLVLNVAVDRSSKPSCCGPPTARWRTRPGWSPSPPCLPGKPPTHWDDQDRARFEVQLAASARTFEHFRVLAFEMDGGAALLDGDREMLRISISVPEGGEVERVVKVPPALSSQAAGRGRSARVLQEQNLLDEREASVAVLARCPASCLPRANDCQKEDLWPSASCRSESPGSEAAATLGATVSTGAKEPVGIAVAGKPAGKIRYEPRARVWLASTGTESTIGDLPAACGS